MRILLLDLDTLRADHLGCYGYARNTSPNIDRIASEGVRFDQYYCSDAPCLPSRTALMTGRFGIHTGVVGHGGTAADLRLQGAGRDFQGRLGQESLWAVMRRRGLHTCSISPFAERHGSWSFYAGFSEMHNTGKRGLESAEDVTPLALDWIERNAAKDDWLLHVNYWDPHTPYRAPEEFGNPFADGPLPEWFSEEVLERHRQLVGPHCAREISMYDNRTNPQHPRQPGEVRDMADLRRLIDGYDCGVAYMDRHIGRLLDALAQQGVMDDLAIIVTSDHGENLGELGIYSEHATADAITCRIPMIVRWCGAQAGHVDTGLHYQLDLGPTLCDLWGIDAPASWDGQSYAQALLTGADAGRDHLVLSQGCHVCQRGVRFGPWMYMRTYHDGYHLFQREMLFNVDDDPHEQVDLAERRQDVCREAVAKLTDWHDDMMGSQLDGYTTDPLQTVMAEGGPEHARGRLAAYCEYLKQTGRQYAIEELKRRHPQEFA
ncbi:MAG: sulfatase [Planctomycetota bacterium]